MKITIILLSERQRTRYHGYGQRAHASKTNITFGIIPTKIKCQIFALVQLRIIKVYIIISPRYILPTISLVSNFDSVDVGKLNVHVPSRIMQKNVAI